MRSTAFPPELAQISGLQTLNLKRTAISDLAPLTGLTNLRTLDLSLTQIFDTSPLAGLTALKKINLSLTAVTDIAFVASLTDLQELDLAQTGISILGPLAGHQALQKLDLNRTVVSDLSPLQSLSSLYRLDIGQTLVVDIAPLRHLNALSYLDASQTAVCDIAPLENLGSLRRLWLHQTQVSDLGPLAELTGLVYLTLQGSKVADLRPIRSLNQLGTDRPPGLSFIDTPATLVDAEIARLALVGNPNFRARQTLAYLNTLPPWPEPYTPKARPDGLPPVPIGGPVEPTIPAPAPAPLQVVESGGVLRPARPGDALDAEGSLLARQGWEALREYLADLAHIRPRIGNQMPTMDRALARFEAALGSDYDRANPVSLGTHGNRIMRLAGTAEDSLSAADAAELVEFAAAVALFLERFPVWRAYREEALARPLTAAEALAALQPIEELADELFERPEIDPEIARSLKDQVAEVREQPEDTLASKGLVASTRNVLAKIAELAWRGVKGAGRAATSFGKLAVDETKNAAAKGLAGAALDILLNNARILLHLAETMPKEFGWIVTLLKALGVAIP